MIDLIACILVRGLNLAFRLVPVSLTLWLGRRIGSLVFFFNKKRRMIAYANLKSAFAGEKSPKELRQITKRVYQNMAQTFVEVLNLTKVNRRYVDKYVRIVNIHRYNDFPKLKRGMILLTGHFGDWELSSLTSAVLGVPILVLAREQKMKRLNELLNRLRESKGCKVIRKGMNTKNMLRALYDKSMVGILSDQDAGKNGVFVDFFGRPTSTHVGPMIMALRTDSIVLPNLIVRVKGPYHTVFVDEYIDPRDYKDKPEDVAVKEMLQKFATVFESYIRKYPDQWLWPHKRWKSTPTRTVLVLDDGKAGHLNQSLAVAKQIRKARTTQGYASEDTRIAIVNVKYKNKLSRAILTFLAGLATWRCQGRMGGLKYCLTKKSYEDLMKTYSDFVVSCGSSLAPVNIFMSIENNAKNIVLMKPNVPLGLDKFDLAIIPMHDKVSRRKNVLNTRLAPNLMDRETMASCGQRLKDRIHVGKHGFVGVLLGGDNDSFSFTRDIAQKVSDDLAKFADESGAELLVTTSRRTPKDVEHVLKERFKHNAKCKLLVIANEKNIDEAVGGILDLSDVIVVSGESVSMVSEAISSGKKVVAFELAGKANKATKYERILRGLGNDGHVIISEPDRLEGALKRAWHARGEAKPIKDSEKIFEAVRRLI